MVEIEIDGEKIKAEPGSPLLQAALDAGKPIPHFCYHKKLSVTASCRMCLVEVGKMSKLVPACATPVTEGMVVRTDTEEVIKARRAVMEFLLINHPLDCPVCDQGGECLLQDYSVEYGANASRYQEEKRIVFVKNVGPLISMQEMSRCIQCTRCIRFGTEIGGLTEFGMVNRGDRSEITTFPTTWVNSELSGNMIDVCPVGALTSKPFRYKARGWELASHFSVSPHDGLGSNLNVQTLRGKVMRVLPFANEAVNECWLSDRDRFSYEALGQFRPADGTDGQAGQPLDRNGLGNGAELCRIRIEKYPARSWSDVAGGFGIAPGDSGRMFPVAETDAADGIGKNRIPAQAVRFFSGWEDCSLAGDAC